MLGTQGHLGIHYCLSPLGGGNYIIMNTGQIGTNIVTKGEQSVICALRWERFIVPWNQERHPRGGDI